MVNEDGSSTIGLVRCKESHTNQCSHFISNHPLEHKRGVVKTLMIHRVNTIVSDERDKVDDRSHVKHTFTMNCYPEWLINSIPTIQPSLECTTSVSSDDHSDDVCESEIEPSNKKPPQKEIPSSSAVTYIQGVTEQIKRAFKQYHIRVYFKPMNTVHVRQSLVRLKDKLLKERVVGLVYHIPCGSCDAS